MGNIDRVAGRYIVQAPSDYSFCAGCSTCEIVCSLTHDGLVGPCYNRIFVEKDTRMMYFTIHSCQQCSDHPCYDACPKRDMAMRINDEGIAFVDEEFCIGCGACRRACLFDPPRINMVKNDDKSLRKAKKCDLCFSRAEGPACVEWCPVRCLSVSE